jgi:hypothetical protein
MSIPEMFSNMVPPSIRNINASSLGRTVDNLRADAESRLANLDIEEKAVEFSNIAKDKFASITPGDISALSSVASNKIASLTKGNLGKLSAIPTHLKEMDALIDAAVGGGTSLRANPHSGLQSNQIAKDGTFSSKSGGTDLPRRGAEGGIANKDTRHPNVIPNILNDFVSVNYVVSLGILDIQEVNYPDETYRKHGPKTLIIKSGGGKPTGKQKMVKTAEEGSHGDMEFFIDDLEMDAVVNPAGAGHLSTNATLTFTVTEPYSMGQFMEAMQIASLGAGYTHYPSATFVLIIDWIGWDANGVAKRISDMNVVDQTDSEGNEYQHSRRYIPIEINDAAFSVNAGGCIYEVKANSSNDAGLNNSVQKLPVDVTIAGETVHEMLQTGPNSLTKAINDNLVDGKAPVDGKFADHYIIQFTKDEHRKSSTNEKDSGAGGEAPAVLNESDRSGLSSKSTQVSGKNMIETLLRNVDHGEGTINGIGQSTVIYDSLLNMNQIHKQKSEQKHKPKDVLNESNVHNNVKEKTIAFKQNTSISDIISEVILCSEWAKSNGANGPDDDLGFRKWFKIECRVYSVPIPEATGTRGTMPKIYVYRVVFHKVHGSIFATPNTIPKGSEALRSKVVKKYDYMYTGLNKDIINFNIEYNSRFLTPIQADLGNNNYSSIHEGSSATSVISEDQGPNSTSSSSSNNIKTGLATSTNSPGHPSQNGVNTPKPKPEEFSIKRISENTQTANYTASTRAIPSSKKQEIARMFHQATINSDADMVNIEIDIYGDPYYLSDSGYGNYSSPSLTSTMLDAHGQIAYETSMVYIVIEFRTPTDLDPKTGIMKFPSNRTNDLVDHFSGIYYITRCASSFSKGLFKQTLSLVRQNGQANKKKADDIDKGAVTTDPNAVDTKAVGAEVIATADTSDFSSSKSGGAELGTSLEFKPDPRLSLTINSVT